MRGSKSRDLLGGLPRYATLIDNDSRKRWDVDTEDDDNWTGADQTQARYLFNRQWTEAEQPPDGVGMDRYGAHGNTSGATVERG